MSQYLTHEAHLFPVVLLSDFLKGQVCGKVSSAEESKFINTNL